MSNVYTEEAYYSVLFEYYKPLLTNKQIDYFTSYYYEDFSLAEIAEAENVSRNAVWDNLKKTISQLEKYENLLGLFQKDCLLRDSLIEIEKHTDEEGKKLIKILLERE